MTEDERQLLLGVARLLRNHINDVEGLRGRPTKWEATIEIDKLLDQVSWRGTDPYGPKWGEFGNRED